MKRCPINVTIREFVPQIPDKLRLTTQYCTSATANNINSISLKTISMESEITQNFLSGRLFQHMSHLSLEEEFFSRQKMSLVS